MREGENKIARQESQMALKIKEIEDPIAWDFTWNAPGAFRPDNAERRLS
jgi:hypothetical protein